MGLGGDDSWSPCVHDKYLVPPVEYSFSIRFSLLGSDRVGGHKIFQSQF